MQTTDTFTDAQGRHYVAGVRVPDAVWGRILELEGFVHWVARTSDLSLHQVQMRARELAGKLPARG